MSAILTRLVRTVPPAALACGIAAVLAVGVIAQRLSEQAAVSLPLVDWRCAADHDTVRPIPRGDGGVAFRHAAICDAWVRR